MNWWMLKRKIHTSWLIAIFGASFIVGISFAKSYQLDFFTNPLWMVVFILLIIIICARQYIYLIPILILIGVILGLWRGNLQSKDYERASLLDGKTITVVGTVREDVDSDNNGNIVAVLRDIKINDEKFDGNIWTSFGSRLDIQRSDVIIIEGKVDQGFGSYIGAMYRANLLHASRPTPGDTALHFRDWFSEGVKKSIDAPASSLGIGYLVGQKKALPSDLVDALKIAGLTHIVVASGYNLTILVRLARRLFARISKYLAAMFSGLMIFGFVMVTGLSPSMTRAGIVASLSLLAWYYGRKFNPVVLLIFVGAVTLLINPSYAWGDLGWELSFAAFAGVMILAPLLKAYYFGDREVKFIGQVLIETISATIVTAPILIAAFGQISNVSLIANILILPLVPLAMLLTFVAGLGALIVPASAAIIGKPAQWLLDYMIGVANFLSNLPWAISEVEFSAFVVGAVYVFILLVCVYLWRVTGYNLRESNIVK